MDFFLGLHEIPVTVKYKMNHSDMKHTDRQL